MANFTINDKCASGAGSFIETMARALQVKPEDMGGLSARHTKEVSMDTQCVVFAESEVISLIHRQTAKEDIAYAIHEGLASRLSSMARRVGVVPEVAMIGGPSYNCGLAKALAKNLKTRITVPENSEYVSALGAAVYAAEFFCAAEESS
jgi:benzoyl-CoA reductase subunit D